MRTRLLLSSRRGVRGRGFTLIELMISICIMLFIAVLILPQWSRYRSKQDANQAAQEIAAALKKLASDSLRYETCQYMNLDSTTGYSLYQGSYTYGGNYAFTAVKVRNWSKEYGRARITAPSAGSGVRITYGPRGWVVDSTTVPTGCSTIPTTLSATTDTTNGNYYTITITSGNGTDDMTYNVLAYVNGRVTVTSYTNGAQL